MLVWALIATHMAWLRAGCRSSLRWEAGLFGGGGDGCFVEEHGGSHLFVPSQLFIAVGSEAEFCFRAF